MINDYISEDKLTINLPVPLGTITYIPTYTCFDGCMHQRAIFEQVLPDEKCESCSRCPGHTVLHCIGTYETNLSNVSWLLNNWGTSCFASEKEAEEYAQKELERRRAEVVKLGFILDDKGYSDMQAIKNGRKILPDVWNMEGVIELKDEVPEGSELLGAEGFTFVDIGVHTGLFCKLYRDKDGILFATLNK